MAYTPIIAKADLYTNLYSEIIEEITRTNDDLVTAAIDNAIGEAKIYLARYDLKALFGSVPDDTAPTFTDPFLSGIIKDIAMWNLIKLANPNVLYDHIKSCYEGAIKTLMQIQSLKANPAWPLVPEEDAPATPAGSVRVIAGTQRDNYY